MFWKLEYVANHADGIRDGLMRHWLPSQNSNQANRSNDSASGKTERGALLALTGIGWQDGLSATCIHFQFATTLLLVRLTAVVVEWHTYYAMPQSPKRTTNVHIRRTHHTFLCPECFEKRKILALTEMLEWIQWQQREYNGTSSHCMCALNVHHTQKKQIRLLKWHNTIDFGCTRSPGCVCERELFSRWIVTFVVVVVGFSFWYLGPPSTFGEPDTTIVRDSFYKTLVLLSQFDMHEARSITNIIHSLCALNDLHDSQDTHTHIHSQARNIECRQHGEKRADGQVSFVAKS